MEQSKIVPPIEVTRSCVGIHGNGSGCHLRGTEPCPFQRVHQKKFSQTLILQQYQGSYPSKGFLKSNQSRSFRIESSVHRFALLTFKFTGKSPAICRAFHCHRNSTYT
jgi:hypothetical protein